MFLFLISGDCLWKEALLWAFKQKKPVILLISRDTRVSYSREKTAIKPISLPSCNTGKLVFSKRLNKLCWEMLLWSSCPRASVFPCSSSVFTLIFHFLFFLLLFLCILNYGAGGEFLTQYLLFFSLLFLILFLFLLFDRFTIFYSCPFCTTERTKMKGRLSGIKSAKGKTMRWQRTQWLLFTFCIALTCMTTPCYNQNMQLLKTWVTVFRQHSSHFLVNSHHTIPVCCSQTNACFHLFTKLPSSTPSEKRMSTVWQIFLPATQEQQKDSNSHLRNALSQQ